MNNESKRLVLRYERGQASFGHINPSASPEQLHMLATAINTIQDEPVNQIAVVTTRQF